MLGFVWPSLSSSGRVKECGLSEPESVARDKQTGRQLKRSSNTINKLRWMTPNLAKTYLAYPSTLSETGTVSRPIIQRLFLNSLTRLSARAGWNQRGPLSSHTFNRYQLIVSSKSAPPHTSFQFIKTAFEKAKLNVRINGKKFEDLKEEDDGTLSRGSWLALGFITIAFEFRQGS